MPYAMPQTVRIDLSEPLGPGCFAEVRHPKLLPYAVSRRAAQAADPAATLLAAVVVAWNLEDPATGQPLPVPGDDLSVVDRVPTAAVVAILETVNELSKPPAVPKP